MESFADLPAGIGRERGNENSILNRINTFRPVQLQKPSGIVGNARNLVEILEAYLCCYATLIIRLIEPECRLNKIDPYATQVPLGRRSYTLD